MDLREPNKAIVVDSYSIPHMEELFSQLRGAVMVSTIDLANAYHQVPLHEESRDLTAFITHDGLFRFMSLLWISISPSSIPKADVYCSQRCS